jgi:hypothetical protein
MRDKRCYSPIEIAQICEAYLVLRKERGVVMAEEVERYESFVPESIRNAITLLRNMEFGFYSNEPKIRESTKKSKNFKKFEEFFKAYD